MLKPLSTDDAAARAAKQNADSRRRARARELRAAYAGQIVAQLAVQTSERSIEEDVELALTYADRLAQAIIDREEKEK